MFNDVCTEENTMLPKEGVFLHEDLVGLLRLNVQFLNGYAHLDTDIGLYGISL